MKFIKIILAFALLGSSLLFHHSAAYACSGGDFTLAKDFIGSDVVVGGRILAWKSTGKKSDNGRQVIRVSLQVRQKLKGQISDQLLTFYDEESLVQTEPPSWDSDTCGSFAFDPTGKYIIVGLGRGSNGLLYSTSWGVYYLDDEPTDSHFTEVLMELENIQLHPDYPYTRFAASFARRESQG